MESLKKLKLLSSLCYFEHESIYRASTPFGKRPMLKILQTTMCEKNCEYCIFIRSRERTVPHPIEKYSTG